MDLEKFRSIEEIAWKWSFCWSKCWQSNSYNVNSRYAVKELKFQIRCCRSWLIKQKFMRKYWSIW